MYKSLINRVIDEKQKEAELELKKKSLEQSIANKRYNINDIYVGYIAKRIITRHNGKDVLKQMVKQTPVILYPIELNHFKDISCHNTYYPLVRIGENPNTDDYYLSEKYIESFTGVCSETLSIHNISENASLTAGELSQILAEQESLKEMYFN
ncbi:MAG: hypothetical protein ACLRFE_00955 [Clostridia bacterium]